MKRELTICGVMAVICLWGCSENSTRILPGDTHSGSVVASAGQAVVTTKYGKVAGYLDGGLYIFKGIPYARAERFMPPLEPEPWDNIRSSRAYGPSCPQGARTGWASDEMAFAFDWDDGHPGEDCLRLNIWTPGLTDGIKRPVMVWLHGGGYSAGSAQELPSYDGAALAAKGDVVLISLNHRLNVLGFLDLSAFGEKYAQSGNAGMLDIVAALQWIRDNVTAFGGDPGNVTVFGQSGGGGKVSTLLTAPSAAGLFHKAIIQSGSMTSAMDQKYSRRIGVAVVQELGLQPSEINKLQDVPYEDLLAAGEKAVAKVKEAAAREGVEQLIFGWAPTVDGIFLTRQPFTETVSEHARNIPVIIGTTLHEFLASAYLPALKNMTVEQAKTELKKIYRDRTDAFIDALGKAYPDFKPADLFDIDIRFRPEAIRQATLMANQKGASVYMYLFTWESPVMDGLLRSMHCMELPFVFRNIERCRNMTGGGDEARKLAEKMSGAWLHFARTGSPQEPSLPAWEPFNPVSGATMIFDTECKISYHHDKELMNLIK